MGIKIGTKRFMTLGNVLVETDMKLKLLLLVSAIMPGAAGNCLGAAAGVQPEGSSWLAAQAHIQRWSADFTQTRTLKSLAQPLTASGHVWFEAPNRFRWELGHP